MHAGSREQHNWNVGRQKQLEPAKAMPRATAVAGTGHQAGFRGSNGACCLSAAEDLAPVFGGRHVKLNKPCKSGWEALLRAAAEGKHGATLEGPSSAPTRQCGPRADRNQPLSLSTAQTGASGPGVSPGVAAPTSEVR